MMIRRIGWTSSQASKCRSEPHRRRTGARYHISTNFNPYDFGIIDAVAQELLSEIVRAGKEPVVERWGIIAELYQLNIYSGPSGMFKSHVDTPRRQTPFGSLAVVLPTKFQDSTVTRP
ncbi:hypothetical protein F5883DRAFT_42319 [Diaporthe sp. PMI_573]|nr:hypothetical protein F5883DRAFT_42319 [Diaporthaceae sp. PMI_573]